MKKKPNQTLFKIDQDKKSTLLCSILTTIRLSYEVHWNLYDAEKNPFFYYCQFSVWSFCLRVSMVSFRVWPAPVKTIHFFFKWSLLLGKMKFFSLVDTILIVNNFWRACSRKEYDGLSAGGAFREDFSSSSLFILRVESNMNFGLLVYPP